MRKKVRNWPGEEERELGEKARGCLEGMVGDFKRRRNYEIDVT